MSPHEQVVRNVLTEQGRLNTDIDRLGLGDSLYGAGLTSHASVNVMLALEDAFDVEFPERLLRRSTFESVGSLCAAVESLDGAEVR